MKDKNQKFANSRDKEDRNINKEGGINNKYGEFVPSFDCWMMPDKQRKIAQKLENPGDGSGRADIETDTTELL